MEAHDRRRRFQHHREHLGIVGKTFVDLPQCSGWFRVELREQRFEPFQPCGFAGRIGVRAAMYEKIDIKRTRGARSCFLDHRARAIYVGSTHGNGAQCTRVRYSGRHRGRRHACHRRLDQRD